MSRLSPEARLHPLRSGSPYQGYAYAYPHKTAYRPIEPPLRLETAWAAEPRDSLFLYLHVPFCEMRCGFCNLFTRNRPPDSLVDAYLEAIHRQAILTRCALGPSRFAQLAIGGGTPSSLSRPQLERLLAVATHLTQADLAARPAAIEVSPGTLDAEKLALLRQAGITRVSIGVESFHESETDRVYRPQKRPTIHHALDLIRHAAFPTLNIDLIYGLPGQTLASWLDSLRSALHWRPEELYLYPLYVRPLTGLDRRPASPSPSVADDLRLTLYREARALLASHGYHQRSMRFFRRADARDNAVSAPSPPSAHPVYRCQDDGMLGLGCGARSYTRQLHYSTPYAVGGRHIAQILDEYIARSDHDHLLITHGDSLPPDDQRRRYVIQSLLTVEGLDLAAYRLRFGSDPLDDLPQLLHLAPAGLAQLTPAALLLTDLGLERSDAIGPWLQSDRVRRLRESYPWR